MSVDPDLILAVATWFDAPNVYMGGPSAQSQRKAAQLLNHIESLGYTIVWKSEAHEEVSDEEAYGAMMYHAKHTKD